MLRRSIAYGLVIAIVALILFVAVSYTLSTAKPPGYTQAGDYTPQQISDEAAKFIAAAAKVNNCLQDTSGGTPLDMTLTDAAINARIRSLPASQLARLPAWLSNPQVVFRGGQVVLMGDIDYQGSRTVASFRLDVGVTDQGDLELEMAGTRAGRMPLPDMVGQVAIDHLDRKIAALEPKIKTADNKKRAQRMELELLALTGMRGLLKGEPVTLQTRRHRLKLETVQIDDGRIRIVGRRVEKPDA
ncbi:MAG: hypothetical protein GWP05_10790 [Anaerolineaceae bacterium]|nr:hypothetical protein [Anaerolineaceae bacterium]